MNDLDWLARNVHKWPAGHQGWCYIITNMDGSKGVSTSLIGQVDCPWVRVEVQDWKSRRAELQNKPSWDDAPKWASSLTQSSAGTWVFFETEVSTNTCGGWGNNRGRHFVVASGEVLGDWRDTLEKRPEKAEFDPFVSVEDAATSKKHDPVNNPSHYASGGIECIEAIKASVSHEAFLGYLKGNVQKYTWRYEKKVNPAEDLKKARWYLDKLIEEQK